MFIAHNYEKYYKVKEGDVVYDLGAYNGRHTILYSYKVGEKGLVISIEPSFKNYIKLLYLIEEYKLNNVIPLNIGIGNKNTKRTLLIRDEYRGAADSFYERDDIKVKGKQEILVLTLDTIPDFIGNNTVNFIKSDIEGSEIEAIEGGEELLSKTKNVAFASYHVINEKCTVLDVERKLKHLGFNTIISNEVYTIIYGTKGELGK